MVRMIASLTLVQLQCCCSYSSQETEFSTAAQKIEIRKTKPGEG